MIILTIAAIIFIIGIILGINGFPLIGFVVGACGGLLPVLYEPVKSLFKK
jgi:hypothetical protein